MTEDQSRNLLLSVKPNFADLLLSGEKTAELRRTQPRVNPGSVALVYSSTPQKALVGAFRIDGVHTLDPANVWEVWAPRFGLLRAEFNEYVAGCNSVTVLLLNKVRAFPVPIPLAILRHRWDRFVAPQSFRYVATNEIAALLNGEGQIVEELSMEQTIASRSSEHASHGSPILL
jgi:predicted transcriptional regulator